MPVCPRLAEFVYLGGVVAARIDANCRQPQANAGFVLELAFQKVVQSLPELPLPGITAENLVGYGPLDLGIPRQ